LPGSDCCKQEQHDPINASYNEDDDDNDADDVSEALLLVISLPSCWKGTRDTIVEMGLTYYGMKSADLYFISK
jgi:hypothetical protein